MHPASQKLLERKAQADSTTGLAELKERLDRIEANQDKILEGLKHILAKVPPTKR